MFIQDFIEIGRPPRAVLDQLLMPGFLSAPDGTAAAVPGPIDLGVPRSRYDGILVPVRWDMTPMAGIGCTLAGDFEVRPMPPEITHLLLFANYANPADAEPRVLERHVAITVRNLLKSIAQRLHAENQGG